MVFTGAFSINRIFVLIGAPRNQTSGRPLNKTNKKQVVSFEYRPLIGFLTETIDQCLCRETKIRTEDVDREDVTGRLAENRQTMDRAMLTLENTIQLILKELENPKTVPAECQCARDAQSARTCEAWMEKVFPQDDIGQALRSTYTAVARGE